MSGNTPCVDRESEHTPHDTPTTPLGAVDMGLLLQGFSEDD